MAERIGDGGREKQRDLRGLEVRPVRADERGRWKRLMSEHHYLRSAALVGDGLRHVAEIEGRWLALLGWATAAFKCKPRDRWIGWSPTSQWRRLKLVVCNARFLVLAGHRSYVAIGEWAQALPEDLVKALGGTYSKRARRYRAPSGDTLRRAILNADAEQVDRIVGNWIIKQGISMSDGAIAVDGKTLRGSHRKASKPVHLLAALTHREGVVIAQQRVSDESNEIPAAREILDHLDLGGAMVTMDAMHTQTATADCLTQEKGRITSSR